jgi:hypothetical protein
MVKINYQKVHQIDQNPLLIIQIVSLKEDKQLKT